MEQCPHSPKWTSLHSAQVTSRLGYNYAFQVELLLKTVWRAQLVQTLALQLAEMNKAVIDSVPQLCWLTTSHFSAGFNLSNII